MLVAKSRRELIRALEGRHDVGLVATMGALHKGHEALLKAAREESKTVVASVFVNPAQFDSAADLAGYPRDESRDLHLLAQVGVDVAFVPTAAEIYPPGFDTFVEPGEIGRVLEGRERPGHFRGVATIVLKLLNLTKAARAYFGAKDAQQVAVVRRLVEDLDLDVAVRVVATVRDEDGLALSSRNALLSPKSRLRALALPRALERGLAAFAASEDAAQAADEARKALAASKLEVDYVEVADFGPLVLVAAVRVDGVRLLDNVVLFGDWC